MKRSDLMSVMVAALMALAACRGERATVTGEYGAGVVAGKVAVNGLNDDSPAGVRVTVRGTGMTTTLAEDGAFTFMNVPENAVLVFQRADGIDAMLELSRSSGFINVSLSPAGAVQQSSSSGGGRRRSASSGGTEYQFEGTVRSASATEVVVFTSHQEEVTFTVNAATITRKGQTTVDPATLAVDTRVHVKATRSGDAYTATQIIVQEEDEGDDEGEREAKEYEGVVRSASDTQLVILDSHGDEVTFVLDASTEIRKGQTAVLGSALKEGDRVHVRATTSADGSVKTASLVIVQDSDIRPQPQTYEGTAKSATDTKLVADVRGTEMTFVLDSSTVIRKQGQSISGSAISAGDKVTVKATTASDGTKTATEVTVAGGRKK